MIVKPSRNCLTSLSLLIVGEDASRSQGEPPPPSSIHFSLIVNDEVTDGGEASDTSFFTSTPSRAPG